MEIPTILIVEDDPIIAADLEDRLREMGYAVAGTVPAGEQALFFFDKKPIPDLLLLDIQLEGQWDGIETARRIRQHHDLPIIFLTSNADDATFNKAKQVNPHAFLSKPFRGRDLKHAIELAVAKAASQKSGAVAAPSPGDNTYLLNDRLFIKVKDRMVRLLFKDILWVAADDYYCKVFTAEKEFLVTETLKKFSEKLAGVPELLRVHRSYLVNLTHVEEIGELYLHVGKERIPYSKNFSEEILSRLRSA
jgi:DNA-binding LytR/AlgR family response regulator